MGKWKHQNYKRKKNKKFFIVIAVIVLIAFAMAYDFGGIRTTIEEKSSEIKSSPSTSKGSILNDYCKENIIIKELKVWTKRNGEDNSYLGKQVLTSILENDPWRATINSPEWKDGIEIGGIPRYSDFKQICRLGSKKGENINYRYCEGLTYFKNIQKTSENGQINGYDKNNYTITLVIEKDKYKMEQAYSNGLRAGDIEKNGFFFYYNVVDYDCKKV